MKSLTARLRFQIRGVRWHERTLPQIDYKRRGIRGNRRVRVRDHERRDLVVGELDLDDGGPSNTEEPSSVSYSGEILDMTLVNDRMASVALEFTGSNAIYRDHPPFFTEILLPFFSIYLYLILLGPSRNS